MARRRGQDQILSLVEVAALAEERYPYPDDLEGYEEHSRLSSLRFALVREHGYSGLEYLRLRMGTDGPAPRPAPSKKRRIREDSA